MRTTPLGINELREPRPPGSILRPFAARVAVIPTIPGETPIPVVRSCSDLESLHRLCNLIASEPFPVLTIFAIDLAVFPNLVVEHA